MKKILFVIVCVCGAVVTAQAQLTYLQPRGVSNTGNAAVSDVATGKTFSSAVATNVTGTSTKDATVGGSAPILPVQAFVDHINDFWRNGNAVALTNKGLTHFDSALLYTGGGNPRGWIDTNQMSGGGFTLDFSTNALTAADVNAILSVCASAIGVYSLESVTLDLSGGTNAAPTGQGITDKAALITAGWTVTTN